MGHSRMHPQSAEGAGRNDCQTLSSLKVNGEWEKYLRTAEKLVTPVFTNSREEMMGNQWNITGKVMEQLTLRVIYKQVEEKVIRNSEPPLWGKAGTIQPGEVWEKILLALTDI